MQINRIAVCGAGTMGSGIALAAAQAGIHTQLYDINDEMLQNAKVSMNKNLDRLVQKGKMDMQEKEAVMQRLQFINDIQYCIADVFIEAIVEKPEVKINLFNQLAKLNHSETIFATNTSSLSVTSIAVAIQNPERVIGMHFFNPATIMKLVEVVTTPFTNPSTVEAIVTLAKQMNKVPVVCKDSPGFIVNRVARPFYIESLRIAEENNSNYQQVDAAMEAAGFKMGPFVLMDLIGNDINHAVSCSVYEQLQDPERLRPSYLQAQKVKEGKLGKKSGEGFYNYAL